MSFRAVSMGCGRLILALWAGSLGAAGPVISAVSDNGPVGRYGKLEVSFSLGTTYANPYDPSQIDAHVVFSGPGGVSATVNAFYYQGYTRSGSTSSESLSAAGAPGWRARFAPSLTGSWTYQIQAVDSANVTSTANSAAAVTVNGSASHGFIHVSPADSRYFRYDDGTVYVPVGEDMAWSGSGNSYQFDQWQNALAAGGGNFMRVWMAAWGMVVDWDQSTHSQTWLGDYDNHQKELWDLDHVMDNAAANGQAIMLCLIHHGEFSSTTNPNWPDNIMSSAWGGPLTAPDLVWTNATAQALMKRRWRYLVARYAYSPALESWELWNEMNWTDNFDASHTGDAATWHQMMHDVIRAQDPYQHIITTSLANGMGAGYAGIWGAGMEMSQNHIYGATDWAQTASDNAAAYLAAYPGKPFHLGEFGMSDAATATTQDPTGMSLAEAAWGGLMSGAASGGATWWWDTWVPTQNLYWRYKGISAFLAGEDLDQRAYVAARPVVSTATRADVSVSPAFNNGTPWGSPSPASTFTLSPTGTLSPSAASLGTYLWGTWTAGKNPPSFVANYAVAGQFQVLVTNASTSGTVDLTVKLDGATTALNNTAVTVGSTYSIAVPAGAHTIAVDGTGQDWMVPVYTFTNYGSMLRCYALTGTAKALGWVQSRNNTFWNQCASCQGGAAKPLPSVSDGVVQLTGLSNDGTWNYSWYETVSGTVKSSGTAVCSGGALNLAVPAMATDQAFKLTYAGAAVSPTNTGTRSPSPTSSPSRTASPSPSQTPSPTASPTPTRTPSASSTSSPSPSATAAAGSPTDSPSLTPTPSPSPSATASASPSAAVSPSATDTAGPSLTPSDSATPAAASATASPSPSFSPTPDCPGGGFLGYSGADSNTDFSGYMVGNPAALPVNGMLSAMEFYVMSGSGQVRVAVYSDTGSGPGSLLAQAGPVTVGPGPQSVPLGPVLLAPATYWLFIQNTAGVDLAIGTTGATPPLYSQAGAFGAFPATLSAAYGGVNWSVAMLALVCPLPSPTPTATLSASPSVSPTSSASPTPSPSPSSSAQASPTASASATASPTGSPSPTSAGSPSPSATPGAASPTVSPAATATPLPSGTASPTASPTVSVTATPSASPMPSGTATRTPTPSPSTDATATVAVASPSPGSGDGGGPLRVVQMQPVPNPNPRALYFYLSAPADQVRLRVWSPAMVLMYEQGADGPWSAGWQSLTFRHPDWDALPDGLLFYSLDATQGAKKSLPRAPGRMVRLH